MSEGVAAPELQCPRRGDPRDVADRRAAPLLDHRHSNAMNPRNGSTVIPSALVPPPPLAAAVAVPTSMPRGTEYGYETRPWVLGVRGDGATRQVELAAGTVILGSGPRCSVVLRGRDVAREHARLDLSSELARLSVFPRAAPALLNGVQVREAGIEPGDSIEVGGVHLTLHRAERQRAVADRTEPQRAQPQRGGQQRSERQRGEQQRASRLSGVNRARVALRSGAGR